MCKNVDDNNAQQHLRKPKETFITYSYNNVHPHKGLFREATPAFTIPPHSPLGPTWL